MHISSANLVESLTLVYLFIVSLFPPYRVHRSLLGSNYYRKCILDLNSLMIKLIFLLLLLLLFRLTSCYGFSVFDVLILTNVLIQNSLVYSTIIIIIIESPSNDSTLFLSLSHIDRLLHTTGLNYYHSLRLTEMKNKKFHSKKIGIN